MAIIKQDYGSIYSDKATQNMIAPVQITLTANKNYSVGESFIYNDNLYKVTQAITGGGIIEVGTNAELADRISDQIYDIHDGLNSTLIASFSHAYSAANTVEYIGSFTLNNSCLIKMRANYSNGNPLFVGISASQNVTNTQFRADNPTPTTIKTSLSLCALLDAGTYYIYASNSAATTNPIFVYKYEIK